MKQTDGVAAVVDKQKEQLQQPTTSAIGSNRSNRHGCPAMLIRQNKNKSMVQEPVGDCKKNNDNDTVVVVVVVVQSQRDMPFSLGTDRHVL